MHGTGEVFGQAPMSEEEACLKIQNQWHIYKAKKLLELMRAARVQDLHERAKVLQDTQEKLIQARKMLERAKDEAAETRLKKLLATQDQEKKLFESSLKVLLEAEQARKRHVRKLRVVVFVQTWWRYQIKRVKEKRQRHKSAVVIQRWFRAQSLKKRQEKRKLDSATFIQLWWRHHIKQVKEKRKRDKCANVIWQWYRAQALRIHKEKERRLAEEARRHKAALRIQKWWKREKERRAFEHRLDKMLNVADSALASTHHVTLLRSSEMDERHFVSTPLHKRGKTVGSFRRIETAAERKPSALDRLFATDCKPSATLDYFHYRFCEQPLHHCPPTPTTTQKLQKRLFEVENKVAKIHVGIEKVHDMTWAMGKIK